MREAFLPVNYVWSVVQHLQYIRQGDWTVEEYAEEFHQLIMHNELDKPEEQLVPNFMDGLRPSILD